MTFLDYLGCSPKTNQDQEETSLLRFPGYHSAKAFSWLSTQNRLAGTKGKEASSSGRNFLVLNSIKARAQKRTKVANRISSLNWRTNKIKVICNIN